MLVSNQQLVGGGLVAINLAFSHESWVSVIIPIDELIFFQRGFVKKPPTSSEDADHFVRWRPKFYYYHYDPYEREHERSFPKTFDVQQGTRALIPQMGKEWRAPNLSERFSGRSQHWMISLALEDDWIISVVDPPKKLPLLVQDWNMLIIQLEIL